MEVGLSLGDFVRWGSSHVPQKGQTPTQFSAHVYCGQTAALTKMPLGTEVDLGLRDIVCDVDPGIPEKNGAPPILAHVYCGQMAGWMKLVLSIEVGRSPGNFVLDGNPAPLPQKGAETPSTIFGPFLLWPNGWMHQDATWYGCRPLPRGLCVRWRPTPHPQKGRSP